MFARAVEDISVKDNMPINPISELNPFPQAMIALSAEESVRPIAMKKAKKSECNGENQWIRIPAFYKVNKGP